MTAGATACSGRAAGASSPASAVGKPPIRTSPARRVVLRGELALQALELREQRVGVAEQHARGGGEPDAAAARLEQRVADLLLERRELLRHRRGREMQRVGGRGERAVVGDGAERAEAAEVDHDAGLSPEISIGND